MCHSRGDCDYENRQAPVRKLRYAVTEQCSSLRNPQKPLTDTIRVLRSTKLIFTADWHGCWSFQIANEHDVNADGTYKKQEDEMKELCKNCNSKTTGLFCAHCGQSTTTKRIDWSFCSKEFFINSLTLHKGMLFTVTSLIRHPKKMVTDYLDGKRICYTGAVQFLLFITIFMGLASLLGRGAQDNPVSNAMINGVEYEIDIHKYMKPIIVIYAIISSFGNYLVYRRRKYNLAEHFLLNFYIIGMVFLLSTVFDLITFYQLSDYDYIPAFLFAMTYYIRIFYDKKIRVVDFFKAIWCITLNLIIALVLLIGGGFIYAYYLDLI